MSNVLFCISFQDVQCIKVTFNSQEIFGVVGNLCATNSSWLMSDLPEMMMAMAMEMATAMADGDDDGDNGDNEDDDIDYLGTLGESGLG